MNSKACFIIAELSANHGGKIEIALETVRAAKRAGADAIKIQTYTADTITLDSKKEHFKINQGTHWDGQYLHDLYKEAYLPWEWHEEIYRVAGIKYKEGVGSSLELTSAQSDLNQAQVDYLNAVYEALMAELEMKKSFGLLD